jgi:hypothetical protein
MQPTPKDTAEKPIDHSSTPTTKASRRTPLKSSKRGKSTPVSANDTSDTTASEPADSKSSKRTILTEAEKRRNHNESEKRRRQVIERGFAGLKHLLPHIDQAGYSRTAQLVEAAEYIGNIIRENNRLRARISELTGQPVGAVDAMMTGVGEGQEHEQEHARKGQDEDDDENRVPYQPKT